jgi:hypothetical protein
LLLKNLSYQDEQRDRVSVKLFMLPHPTSPMPFSPAVPHMTRAQGGIAKDGHAALSKPRKTSITTTVRRRGQIITLRKILAWSRWSVPGQHSSSIPTAMAGGSARGVCSGVGATFRAP